MELLFERVAGGDVVGRWTELSWRYSQMRDQKPWR